MLICGITWQNAWQHQCDINSIKSLKKYSNEIDLWPCLSLPLSVHTSTGMEQWFFPRCINEMVSIPFPAVANSLCYPRENLARASFPYLLTMNVISTNFWTRVNFQDATTRKMALCAHANDVTHRAQCTCAWRPWGWWTAIKFEKNRRVVCKKTNKTNSCLLSIRQGVDVVKARGEPRVNLKYSPRNW